MSRGYFECNMLHDIIWSIQVQCYGSLYNQSISREKVKLDPHEQTINSKWTK